MPNKIYIVSIVKHSINITTTFVGYINNTNKRNIASYIKKKCNIILGEKLEDSNSTVKNDICVYSTNKDNVYVYIEQVFEIK